MITVGHAREIAREALQRTPPLQLPGSSLRGGAGHNDGFGAGWSSFCGASVSVSAPAANPSVHGYMACMSEQ